jgi:hypothetical protein
LIALVRLLHRRQSVLKVTSFLKVHPNVG